MMSTNRYAWEWGQPGSSFGALALCSKCKELEQSSIGSALETIASLSSQGTLHVCVTVCVSELWLITFPMVDKSLFVDIYVTCRNRGCVKTSWQVSREVSRLVDKQLKHLKVMNKHSKSLTAYKNGQRDSSPQKVKPKHLDHPLVGGCSIGQYRS